MTIINPVCVSIIFAYLVDICACEDGDTCVWRGTNSAYSRSFLAGTYLMRLMVVTSVIFWTETCENELEWNVEA